MRNRVAAGPLLTLVARTEEQVGETCEVDDSLHGARWLADAQRSGGAFGSKDAIDEGIDSAGVHETNARHVNHNLFVEVQAFEHGAQLDHRVAVDVADDCEERRAVPCERSILRALLCIVHRSEPCELLLNPEPVWPHSAAGVNFHPFG